MGLTDIQLDIINGTLLGDGYISKEINDKRNNRYRFKQKLANKEYVDYIYNELKEYCSAPPRDGIGRKPTKINGKITHRLEDWQGEYCYSYVFETRKFPIFKELRKKWYTHRKIVPNDLKLNPRVLSHWMWDDGCNNPGHKSITLHTNCFSKDEIYFLVELLKKTFGFSCCAQKKVIQIRAKSYFNFIETIKPYCLWDCMRHKICTDKSPITRENWGIKLNKEKAREIRKLYFHDNLTQKEIGRIYGVTQTTIGRIVNNVTYPEVETRVGGVSGSGGCRISW